MQIIEKNRIYFFKKYGDRTSSLISLYPHFNSFIEEKEELGEVRFIEKKNLVSIANEPFASVKNKKTLILNFFNQKKFNGYDKYIFPISEKLAIELKEENFFVWQVGVEPIFKLDDYFSKDTDPLDSFPIAKSLKRRSAKVREISEVEFDSLKDEITAIKEDWLANKKMSAFEFLNVVDPELEKEFKRFFILEDRARVVALLTAIPIYLNHQVIGYFFNDILKSSKARSATNELLIIEAMRALKEEGVLEVRLGMAPFAQVSSHSRDAKKINNLFEKWKWGYNLSSLYQFKKKLQPSLWRPVFLASNRKNFHIMLINIMRLHLTSGAVKELVKRNWYDAKKKIEMKDVVSKIVNSNVPSTFLNFLMRTKMTIGFFLFFITLDVLKNNTEYFSKLFLNSAYIPGQVTINGLLLGPLFHNHSLHLWGDQISYLLLAGIIEYTFGMSLMLIVTAVGLWASNPFTKLLVAPVLKIASAIEFNRFMESSDYGTSNAVFAMVGALVFGLKESKWLLVPFVFHAIYICFQRESFLSIHHLTGIYLGYVASYSYYMHKKSSRDH